jgi:uncharacterized protein (TIGR00251 family)
MLGRGRSQVSAPVRLSVYVQTRASRTEIVGMHHGLLKIRLAAPPVDGAANAALVAFMADELDVARSHVRIVSGLTGRRKVVEIDGVSQEKIDAFARTG